MKNLMTVLMILVFANLAQAEMLEDAVLPPESEFPIEDQYFLYLTLNEPNFSERKYERDLASIDTDIVADFDWNGELSVVNEIPYSYPWLTRKTLELRVLAEIEQEELNSKGN